ncbi:MAG: TIGR03936 family radical SAM-associated protein [Oscillospiraceae bacterium]|nr:TIGR03936 family radical SAM-associated protein [Oscillospiraceae bacterium]
MQEVTFPIRLTYTKTGRAKYISHLDTMRTMTRALRRAGLPLWYTQGFNPHLYLTFLLPLALGTESRCELVDLRLTRKVDFDILAARIDAHLPPGFAVKSVASPVLPAKSIAWAEYQLTLDFGQGEGGEMETAMRALFEQEEIPARKKTKKGEEIVDIRPHCQLIELAASGDRLNLEVRLAAGVSLNIAPKTLIEAFAEAARPPGRVGILRTRVLDERLRDFL